MKKQKVKIFIDGANVFYTQKHLSWSIDWKKIHRLISKDFNIIETRYYTGVKNNDERMRKFLSHLRKINFKTVTKPLKQMKDSSGGIFYKSNCDVEIAVDLILDTDTFDTLILLSGDSDFAYIIKILQKNFQKKVIVYSSRKTISWELKLAANKYIFFEDIKKLIER